MDFYTDIANEYNWIFPYNEKQKEFTVSYLKDVESSEILDIGCATGNLTFELSKIVAKSYGLDLNLDMIKYALNNFSGKNNLNFLSGDMLKLNNYFKANTMDAVISYGNTIVHLNTENDVYNFFKQVKDILKPSGYLLFQIINYDRILNQEINFLPAIENENVKFERNYIHKKNKIEFRTTLYNKHSQTIRNNSIDLLPLRAAAIEQLLKKSGFNKIKFYGSFDKSEFTESSIPLIVSASII